MTLLFELIALVLALTLHEFAHALVGDWLGDDTARSQGRLSLNPLAHIDPLTTLALPLFLILVGSPVVFAAAKPVPFNPWAVRWGRFGAALVAAGGPATNFLIAIACGLYLRLVPIGATGYQLLGTIVEINIFIGLFNLIPFPPLDGSRLLYAVVPPSVREVMDRIERSGLVVMLVVLFLSYRFLIPVISGIASHIITWLIPGVGLP